MNSFCVTDCRPQSGAARQMGNMVANEYGYMSYCCTDLRPTEVMCFTLAVDSVKECSTHVNWLSFLVT